MDERYVCPERGRKKFRLGQELRQTVYLYGMTGSGKTSLVKNMLSRKSYDYYLAGETRADQIEIPEDGKHHVAVLDDLHELSGESQREQYAEKLNVLLNRRDVWLILISRCRLPQWLMSLHMRYSFLVIEEEDLQLDRQGQDDYFKKWNLNLSQEKADRLWKAAGGNPTLLRFVAMAGGDIKQAVSDMWKYFSCMGEQWDAELLEFLIEMSVVERFDARMAHMVTGRGNVQQLLKKALETGNFLREDNGMYEYNFILKGAVHTFLERKYDREQLARIYYNAGRMYEMYGNIPGALQMYEKCGDEKSILRLLIANARQNPATGHYFELRRYYMMLPEASVATSPVLIAGMSMLQSMLMNSEESERWYRKLEKFAREHEGSAGREAKNRLLYLDIGLPHRGTVQMVDLLKHAGALLKDGKTVLPEFSVTSNQPSLINGGKDFCEWSKRDRELAASIGKLAEFVLGKFGKGLVSIALAESYFEKGLDSYKIVSLAEKGRMQAEGGGKTEMVFVAVGILVWQSVLNGHGEDARDILEGFGRKVKQDSARIQPALSALGCRIYLYQGKSSQVLEWMEEAPDENEDFCSLERFSYLTKIRCYIQFGKYDRAYGLLQRMLYYAKQQKRNYIAMESTLLLAITRYRMGEKDWESLLQECIARAEEYHFVRIFSREGGAVLKLFRAGDFQWKDESYRKQVISECERMERYYPAYLKEKKAGKIVLSENALNILRLQAEGYRTDQIAELLDITVNTVKYHNKETYRKFNVSSKAAAVSEAKNRGLI